MGEAKRRKKAATQPPRTQVLVSYEDHPYLMFEVDQRTVGEALRSVFPPETTNDTLTAWLIKTHQITREKIALVRDYGPDDDRVTMIRDLTILAEHRLGQENMSLTNFRSVIFNYRAGQNSHIPELPSFYIATNKDEEISLEAIRAVSTTNHLWLENPDGSFIELTPPTKKSVTEGKLICVLALWHNDRPDGISIELQPDGTDAEAEFQMHQIVEMIERQTLEFIQMQVSETDAVEFLTWVGQLQTEDIIKERASKAAAIATINYMEESGMLASDDYNGVMWMYDSADSMTVVRGDKPTQRYGKS